MNLKTLSGETCSIWERMTSAFEMIPRSLLVSSTTGSFWIPLLKMTRAASLMDMSGSATIRWVDMIRSTGVLGWTKRRSRAEI